MNDIIQYSQLLAAIATIGAFVYAIVQVRQSKKHKRTEFIIQLHDMYVHDKEMMEMFNKIEYGDFYYDESFHMTLDEKKLDKLLGHFNNICRLHDYLAEKGIGTVIHYPIAPHKQECYKPFLNPSLKGRTSHFVIPDSGLPITEMLADAELSLPISPCMTQEQIEWVVECVNNFR